MPIRRLIFLFLFACAGLQVRPLPDKPKGYYLRIEGKVFRSNPLNGEWEMLKGVQLVLSIGDSIIARKTTGENGSYQIDILLDRDYLLVFSMEGFVDKSVAVSTKHVPLAFRGYGFEFSPLNIEMLSSAQGLDYELLKEPVTRIIFNLKKSAFDYDVEYTRAHKLSVDSLYAQLRLIAPREEVEEGGEEKEERADIRYAGESEEIIERAREKAREILADAKMMAEAQTQEKGQQGVRSVNSEISMGAEKVFARQRAELQVQMDELKSLRQRMQTVDAGTDSSSVSPSDDEEIRAAENLVQMADREIELLIRQSELQKLELQRSRYLLFGTGGFLVLLLIIALLLLRHNRMRAERQALELKNKLLRSQMNPHFIFNSLNSIQNFLLKNDVKQSAKYLAGFSKLVRLILENSREEFITLDREISTIEEYLTLQMLRFKEKFKYKITLSPLLDPTAINIPPMLAQPFIENAIEHGIARMKGQGRIEISFAGKDGLLELKITDNGIGISRAESAKAGEGQEHASLATQITRERIALLNKQRGFSIDFDISDLGHRGEASSGTQVVFRIKHT